MLGGHGLPDSRGEIGWDIKVEGAENAFMGERGREKVAEKFVGLYLLGRQIR